MKALPPTKEQEKLLGHGLELDENGWVIYSETPEGERLRRLQADDPKWHTRIDSLMRGPLKVPKNAPKAVYECRKCKDLGWFEASDKKHVIECECRKRRIIERALAEIENDKPRFKSFTLKTYKPEPENESQEKALRVCKQFVKRWPLCKRGIMMCGPVGVGKTGLLWATVRECAHKTREVPTWGLAADLLSKIRHTYNDQNGADTEYQIINRFSRAPLLLLDDLGVEKESEWSDGIFFRLLGDRHLRELPTLITTNWTEQGLVLDGDYHGVPLKDRIGARLYSRLHESVIFVEIEGKDRRL